MISTELFQIYHLKEMSLSAELFLSCSILQLTFYAISTAYQRKAGFVILNLQVYYIGALLLGLASLLILNEDLLVMNSFSSNNFIVNDYLGFATKLTICLTSVLFFVVINISFREEPIQNNFEYVVLISISILGLLLLCSSNDLITAYLAIELQSVAFYVMAAFKRNSSYSTESGLKYFIIGALSSAFFLFGSSIIYGCMGSLSFDDIRIFLSLNLIEYNSDSLKDLDISPPLFGVYACYTVAKYVYSFALDWPSLVSSTPDSLMGWCVENCEETVISPILPAEFLNNVSSTSLVDIKTEFYWYFTFFYYPIANYYIMLSSSYQGENLNELYYSSSKYLISSSDSENKSALLENFVTHYLSILLDGNECSTSTVTNLNLDLVSIGFLLICISLFIKLSIAPFHFWSLDVYEGSPNTSTFFFAVVPKIGLFVLLFRICYGSFYPIFIEDYQIYFLLLAALSVFVGSVGGLEQRKLKTLLAYSSISHTGYLLLSFSTGSAEGMQMMFYYLAIYMISSSCLWAVYIFLIQKRVYYFNKNNKELGDLVLLKESNPMLALILAITLFSIAGIPPMVGFLAKIGVFLVVVKSSAYLVSVLSILFSVISTFYYIRLIKILYFENVLVGKLYLPIKTQKSFIIAILALLLIIICVDPMPIYLLFYKATLLSGI
jgi:NADH:ubiquinone oxidoreductase subunit 2 (subunit N)